MTACGMQTSQEVVAFRILSKLARNWTKSVGLLSANDVSGLPLSTHTHTHTHMRVSNIRYVPSTVGGHKCCHSQIHQTGRRGRTEQEILAI
jgi:hypothetical protein